MGIWSVPFFTKNDVDDLGRYAVEFFQYYEREYSQYDRREVVFCKVNFHMLLYLKAKFQRCVTLVS